MALSTGDYAADVDPTIRRQLQTTQDDYDDDEPQRVVTRPGRRAPAKDPLAMDIIIDGVRLGTIYPDQLTMGDQIDLEDATTIRAIVGWLEDHAGADYDTAMDVLRPLKLQEAVGLMMQIQEAIGKAISVPKTKRRR